MHIKFQKMSLQRSNETNNLSKAHVTRDSSGLATWEIV